MKHTPLLLLNNQVVTLSLDICENKWHHLTDVQINIQNMILPHVK